MGQNANELENSGRSTQLCPVLSNPLGFTFEQDKKNSEVSNSFAGTIFNKKSGEISGIPSP